MFDRSKLEITSKNKDDAMAWKHAGQPSPQAHTSRVIAAHLWLVEYENMSENFT